jgi:MarR family transcriptional regulator, lower aerobic nicotinate degradation pathway regulator
MKPFESTSDLKLPASLDQRTGFLLRLAHQWTRRAFNDALRPLGIEARHFGVLSAIAEHGALSQKRFVEWLGLDKSVVVLIVDELERLRLAQRQRDPDDRRAHAVQITQEGRTCLRAAQGIAERLGRTVFSGLSQNDRKQLDGFLMRIIVNCQRTESAGRR